MHNGGCAAETRHPAWAAVERLTAGVPVRLALDVADERVWTGLDRVVRECAITRPGTLPSAARMDGRRPLWRPRPPGECEVVLGLCHPKERIRYAALTWAAGRPALLPLVAVRCSDWAGPVRERARALLTDELESVEGGALENLTVLVVRLARRWHGEFARELVDRHLRQARHRATVRSSGSTTWAPSP
ncbi:hypothetical protein ABZ532_21175 [Streptomyces sp. NPDC019396]|uniref:hypothetical protein n=1 Tax=Streptomyces sp. NPDC019396 TaxID=3154687 RepID=UPI0033DDDB26